MLPIHRWFDCFQQQEVWRLCQRDLPLPTNCWKSQHILLNLTFITGNNNRIYTKLYDKRDDFDFHIVNFPFLSSNIPSSPSYGVYISQLIKYARCCSYYDDFGYHQERLVDRLLSQGYKVKRLKNSFKNFMADIQISLGSIRGRWKIWWLIHSLTSFMQWYNWFWVFFFNTDFVTWIVTFYQLMVAVAGVMHAANNAYSIRSTWLCYRLVRFLITAYIC